MNALFKISVLMFALMAATLSLPAQTTVPPPAAAQLLTDDQLDQLVGPIALYPDPLIAEILPAATLPTQIVLADRYIRDGRDPNQVAQQPWDASVQALAHYPNLLKWLDDNLAWTTALGQAYLNQPQDVMDAVQRLRAQASDLGNLQSTPQQQVIYDNGDIEIDPADPQEIYVPSYQPDQVYDQSGIGAPINFGVGFPLGIWLNGDFDWHHRNIVRWDAGHPRPGGWWRPTPRGRDFGQATVWHPVGVHPVAVRGRGDRGYERPVIIGGRSLSGVPFARPEATRGPRREAPPGFFHPGSNGAYVGLANSHDARAASERGRQSLGTGHPETGNHPASGGHSEPTHFSGGGGGGGGGSHKH